MWGTIPQSLHRCPSQKRRYGHGPKPKSYLSEHPNPTTKIGSLKWVVNSPTPKWDPTGFDNHSPPCVAEVPKVKNAVFGHSPGATAAGAPAPRSDSSCYDRPLAEILFVRWHGASLAEYLSFVREQADRQGDRELGNNASIFKRLQTAWIHLFVVLVLITKVIFAC